MCLLEGLDNLASVSSSIFVHSLAGSGLDFASALLHTFISRLMVTMRV